MRFQSGQPKTNQSLKPMRYKGSTDISAPNQTVWAALIDPHQMSTCMPGITSWHVVEENKVFQLNVSWGVDSERKINLPARIVWESLHPPNKMVLVGETAVNQLPITTKGTITLTPRSPAITTLAFHAEVTTPHRMLDRMVHQAAPPLIAKFFKCLKHNLENS